MTAGRPRKSERLKAIHGTSRADRLGGGRHEPVEAIRRPDYLDARSRAAAIFRDLAKQAPWLEGCHSHLLAAYAELTAEIEEQGAASLTAAALAQWRNLAGDLGLAALAKLSAREHFEAIEEEPETPEQKRQREVAAKYFTSIAVRFTE